ncbi:hypothetical protein FHG87_020325 [Trinorchestia longiramus]|nr:hypothetical protein FHG87_020325 [Trinorchestia longiramus]
MGSEFEVLLYHSNIRWLSRGQVLNRVLAGRVELALFLQEHQQCHADCFKNSEFILILVHLADIFAENNNFADFPLLHDCVSQIEDVSGIGDISVPAELKQTIATHLDGLAKSLDGYYPTRESYPAWVNCYSRSIFSSRILQVNLSCTPPLSLPISRYPGVPFLQLYLRCSPSPRVPLFKMAIPQPPQKLNFQDPNWDAWRSCFQSFRAETKLDQEKEDIQIATLRYSMGPESEKVFETFNMDPTTLTYDQVLAKFDWFFKAKKKNVITLRRSFQNKMQKPIETVQDFCDSLKESALECEFPDSEE